MKAPLFIKRLLDKLKKENTGKATELSASFKRSAWAASGRTELMQNRHAVRMKEFKTTSSR